MHYTYIFDPIALAEFKEVAEWYRERSENAASNFVKETFKKIESICDDPLKHRNSYRDFRETSLKKFPFYIIYFVEERNNIVVISSIYHHKRNPMRKYKK